MEAELLSPTPTVAESHEDAQSPVNQEEKEEEQDAGFLKEEGVEGKDESRTDAGMKKRETAALIIQANWRQHRQRVCNIVHLYKGSH